MSEQQAMRNEPENLEVVDTTGQPFDYSRGFNIVEILDGKIIAIPAFDDDYEDMRASDKSTFGANR